MLFRSRELADQVAGELRRLARFLPNTKILTLCGGQPFGAQRDSLQHAPHIIVATPGRLLDHLLIALRLLLIQQPLRAQRQQLMQRQRHLQHTVHRAALQFGENRLELFFHFLVS